VVRDDRREPLDDRERLVGRVRRQILLLSRVRGSVVQLRLRRVRVLDVRPLGVADAHEEVAVGKRSRDRLFGHLLSPNGDRDDGLLIRRLAATDRRFEGFAAPLRRRFDVEQVGDGRRNRVEPDVFGHAATAVLAGTFTMSGTWISSSYSFG